MILEDKVKGIKHYYIDDLEFGLYETDKISYEQHQEVMKKIWEMCAPKYTGKGKVMVFGTSGDIKHDGLKELFYDPQNYKVIEPKDIKHIFIPAYKSKKEDVS